MKQIPTYRFFLTSIVYLLLIGQLWTNAVSYCYWMINSESELIELCSSECTDSEEEDYKKEIDDKFRMNFDVPKFDNSISVQFSHSDDVPSIHHPEITTPPPESFLS